MTDVQVVARPALTRFSTRHNIAVLSGVCGLSELLRSSTPLRVLSLRSNHLSDHQCGQASGCSHVHPTSDLTPYDHAGHANKSDSSQAG